MNLIWSIELSVTSNNNLQSNSIIALNNHDNSINNTLIPILLRLYDFLFDW